MTPTPREIVREYYAALDEHAYNALETLLGPEFVQHRPDRTFETRAAFIEFMRDGRPNPHTRHELDDVSLERDEKGAATVVVHGRVLDEPTAGEGEAEPELFAFTDRFYLDEERIVRLETSLR
ncbi:nuclear transport factor 2 family protein [Halobacteria archaeon AArc-curdl1]|uniref:Nuclear transport factor 2 family protein n=1 Tax=Natronosalvus hydrolyticus TaxID=2979988 RepID=A0AAP2Z977_9EURY|nr:nuclear transport factor 2 family protein [Halobacteria archaeon AArc-curdl1]